MDFKNTLSWPDGMKVLFESHGETYEGEVQNDGKRVFILSNCTYFSGNAPRDRRGYRRSWQVGGPTASEKDRYNFERWDPRGPHQKFTDLRPATDAPATDAPATVDSDFWDTFPAAELTYVGDLIPSPVTHNRRLLLLL